MAITVHVQAERIDVAGALAELGGDGTSGAVSLFCGYCRDEDGRLTALELEHYPGMAERQIEAIAAEAKVRWALDSALVVHRFGLVRPGEEIVLVATASRHRDAAFEATRFVMDFMKTRAPFWKREHLADGTIGGWVAAKATDDTASAAWHTGRTKDAGP